MLRTIPSTEQASQAADHYRRSVPLYPAPLMALWLIGLNIFQDQLLALPLKVICNIASISIIIILLVVFRSTRLRFWSASAVYAIIFCLFHFGATIVYGLNISISSYLDLAMSRWFYLPDTREAVLLAISGLIACGLGIYIVSLFRPIASAVSESLPAFTNILGIAGFVLIALCLIGWFATVIGSGGLSLLTGSYRSWLDSTSGSLLTYTYYGFGLGLTFLAAACPGKLRTLGFGLFGFWCLFALPLGLRGEVLFPVSAALVVTARRQIPLTTKQALICGLVLLALIAIIREVRQVGLESFNLSETHFSPQDALAELGGSLRPVTVVVLWHRAGEDLIQGASYWAPVERALFRLIPDLNVQHISAYEDDRLLNVLIQSRVGFIGFSPIAEAYYNFGNIGVLIVMMLTGLVLGYLDRMATTRLNQAVIGVVLVPLLIQIRNAFVQVPTQIILGFITLGFVVALSRLFQK